MGLDFLQNCLVGRGVVIKWKWVVNFEKSAIGATLLSLWQRVHHYEFCFSLSSLFNFGLFLFLQSLSNTLRYALNRSS